MKGVALFVCEEAGVVTIEPFVEKPAEEMDAELGNKILGPTSGHGDLKGEFAYLSSGILRAATRKGGQFNRIITGVRNNVVEVQRVIRLIMRRILHILRDPCRLQRTKVMFPAITACDLFWGVLLVCESVEMLNKAVCKFPL